MEDFKFQIAGKNYTTKVVEEGNGSLLVTVNGKTYQVELPARAGSAPRPIVRPVGAAAPVAAAAPAAKPAAGGAKSGVKSPLPGVILDIKVNVGDEVKKGQTVIILEAMKMENSINADRDGKVASIKVSKGESVLEGTDLIIIE